MWIVFDVDAKPNVDLSNSEDGNPFLVETVEEAMRFLGERIQFTLGYMADPDGDKPAAPLPERIANRLASFVVHHHDEPTVFTSLRYDSEDGYAHVALLISTFAQPGFRTGGGFP